MYHSNIELYYSVHESSNGIISLSDSEFKHAVNVMRHSPGDIIFITDGRGKIYEGIIGKIGQNILEAEIKRTSVYNNFKKNFTFCLPRLKSDERFEFALEKSAELGITNFLVYNSSRTIAKGTRLERWNKILLNAMKQSLLSYLPFIDDAGSFEDIIKLQGEKIVFEQDSKKSFPKDFHNSEGKYFFIFGPEGGLTLKELNSFDQNGILKLIENRLRTETAVIMCASLL